MIVGVKGVPSMLIIQNNLRIVVQAILGFCCFPCLGCHVLGLGLKSDINFRLIHP